MREFKYGLVFLSILLIGCQGLQTIAPKDRIVLLQGGPHTGSWESSDVFLKYEYIRPPDTIKLGINLKAKTKFDQLSVWVSFLDTEGKILETKSIYNSGYRRDPSMNRRFEGSLKKSFEVPMGTHHIAFQSSSMPYTDSSHQK